MLSHGDAPDPVIVAANAEQTVVEAGNEYPDPARAAALAAPPSDETPITQEAQAAWDEYLVAVDAHDEALQQDAFARYAALRWPERYAAPTPRTHKRSVRQVLIVTDDATIIRHSQLRGLLEVAGNMKTLGEALGVDPSTISRALAGSSPEALSRDERIAAVRLLIGTEEGS